MYDAPLNYLTGAGTRAYPVVWLTWGLTAISIAVVVIVSFLIWRALFRHRATVPPEQTSAPPVQRPDSGIGWIYLGVGISTFVLFIAATWTMFTLAAVGPVPSNAGNTIQVTAHQWWWEARYLSDQPSHIFTTANELHIPTGEPVRILLKSADVIHSFWVPALSGKGPSLLSP